MSYEVVRGMNDILPEEAVLWQRVEAAIRDVARRYNYREIRFPIVEHTELFTRGIGEGTEVVTKQMFTFPDQKGRSLSLRPEGTASVARAYLNAGLHLNDPFQKWLYFGPMFRYEKPQKGRYRQFHQYGIEAIGTPEPTLDVEVIAFAWTLMSELGLGGLSLRLNSIGCPDDRGAYHEALREHFSTSISAMCENCQHRYEDNPLRILDCKEPVCQPFLETAPGPAEFLCADCGDHFERVQGLLSSLALDYTVDPHLVRGLDYYTRTVFELVSGDLGAQDALLGGGRYDGLIESVGGPKTPGVGFAGGTERLILVLQDQADLSPSAPVTLFIASIGETARQRAFTLTEGLRRSGLAVEIDHRGRGLRKQLALANTLGARFVLVLGDVELARGEGSLKRMDTGEETPVDLTVEGLSERLNPGEAHP